MTIIFLIVGAILGMMAGSPSEGAVLGAILGAIIDNVNASNAKRSRAQSENKLEQNLQALERRVAELEKGLIQARSSHETIQPLPIVERVQSSSDFIDTTVVETLETPKNIPHDLLEPAPTPFTLAHDTPDNPVTEVSEDEVKQPDISSSPNYGDDLFEPPSNDAPNPTRVRTKTTPPSRNFLELLTGGNTLVKVGVVLLTIGLGFLLQLAARNGYFPIEARLTLSAVVGIVILGLGWRLKDKRRTYGLSLQGGGVGILYLTVFLGLRLYELIPNGLAFALLAIIATSSAVLAVLQNAQWLAVLGVVGALLAPFFAAGSGGSHVTLFAYYLVVNLGIFAIAYFKTWRPLLLLGFFGTFGLGTFWGGLSYKPELFASTEPFLVLFFLLYLAMCILFALRQPPNLKGIIDGTLTLALPVVVFGLQTALVRPFDYGLAFSSLSLAAIYLLSAWWLLKKQELRLMAEIFIAIGLTFATLAIPLAFDTSLTSNLWALEGVGLLWVGIRQKRTWLRVSGMALQFISLGALLMTNDLFNTDLIFPLGALLFAAATLLSSYLLFKGRERIALWEHQGSPVFLGIGLAAWLSVGVWQFTKWFADPYHLLAILGFFVVTALLCHVLAGKLEWQTLNYPALGLIVGLAWLTFMMADVLLRHPIFPFIFLSSAFWVISFVAYLWILKRSQVPFLQLKTAASLATLWLVAIVSGLELVSISRAAGLSATWEYCLLALPSTALLLLITTPKIRQLAWLKDIHEPLFIIGLLPVIVFVLFWSFAINVNDANVSPLPYVPLLNPLDITVIVALFSVIRYLIQRRREKRLDLSLIQPLTWLFIVIGVFWSSALVARTIHHYLGVPYEFITLFGSTILQTTLSIFWSLIALASMVLATRRKIRIPWLVGALLLALVVVKLFFVELANTTALAKVISFVGVGVLLLLIGYVAPLPPKQPQKVES